MSESKKKKKNRNTGEVRIGYPVQTENGEIATLFYDISFSEVGEAEKHLSNVIVPEEAQDKTNGTGEERTYVIARLDRAIKVKAKIEFTMDIDTGPDYLDGDDDETDEDEPEIATPSAADPEKKEKEPAAADDLVIPDDSPEDPSSPFGMNIPDEDPAPPAAPAGKSGKKGKAEPQLTLEDGIE